MASILLLFVIYISFISLGLPDSVLGAAWPMMHIDLGVDISVAGLLSMTTCFGTIISSLAFSFISRHFRTVTITIVSTTLTAISLSLYATIDNFYTLIPVALVLGLGAGSVDAALNHYVSLHYKAKQMSFLHASWGFGTTVGPFLLSYAFTHNKSWQFGYRTIAIVQASIVLLMIISIPLWKKSQKTNDDAKEDKSIGYSSALKRKGAPFALLGFFAYCAMENMAIIWSSAYAVSRGLGEAKSAAAAGLLFWGITIGRIATGFVADRLGDKKVIRIGLGMMLLGMVLLFLIPVEYVAISLFILGLGFAPLYPSMIHQTPYLYGNDASSTLIGLQMASAYVGSTFMPPLFGLVSNYIGLETLPFALLILFLIVAISTEMKRIGVKNN